MKVVLDTNVLVVGMLTPFGTCGEIARLLASDKLKLCVDARIMREYDDVLRRPRFDIDPHMIEVVMGYIKSSAQICASIPLRKSLPDPGDNVFLEVALAGKADFLITGNTRHFPVNLRVGIQVLSPREFLKKW